MAKPCKLTAILPSLFLIIFSKAMACPSNCQCSTPTTVDCRGTDITTFPTGIAMDTESLRIHSTNLTQIPANAFANMVNLKDIALLNNKLLTTVPVGLFDGLHKLRKIRINYNTRVNTIPDNIFKNLPNLQIIQLKRNGISTLSVTTFRNLPILSYIDLEKNQISFLPSELFDSTVPNISSLHLNDNQLSDLPVDFFRPLSKSLLYLLIGNNQFKKMPVKALEVLEQLEEIDVFGNPLFCNCSLQDFVDWANKSNSLLYPTAVFCGNREIQLLALDLGDCGPSEKATPKQTISPPTLISTAEVNSTAKTSVLSTHLVQTTPSESSSQSTSPKTQPPDYNGNTESQDSSENNQKRKTIILAVSISLVVCVIFIALLFCLFHTGILSTRRFKLRKNEIIIYDAEGNILVKDGEVVTNL